MNIYSINNQPKRKALSKRVLPGLGFGGIILMFPGGVFGRVLENSQSLQPIMLSKRKTPGAIETTSLGAMELIARFELATASLPRE